MIRFFNRTLSIYVLLLLFAAAPALAQSVTKHKVKKGETLFSIAEKQNVSVRQIKNWNNLSGNQLSPGQTLIIKNPGTSTRSKNGVTHTVKPHETLFSIARRYHVNIKQLKKWNNLKGDHLKIGSKLKIYPSKAAQNPSHHPAKQPASNSYTVKSGDSLFRIAKAHHMSISRLKAVNNLSSNTIHVGQKLNIKPPDRPPSLSNKYVNSTSQGKFIRYTIKKSQSRKRLLNKFGMDSTEFEALNQGMVATSFHRGEKVTLLAPADQSFKNPYVVNQSLNKLGTTQAFKYKEKQASTTTSGDLYNPEALTAANSTMALGSVIYVKNEQNGRAVLVLINDRTIKKGLKVSKAVWQALGLRGSRARVTMYRTHE